MVSKISGVPSFISQAFSGLPALGSSAAKVALLGVRFIGAPLIFIIQRLTASIKPVSPQMAAASVLVWGVTLLGIYLLNQKKPNALPNPAGQQEAEMDDEDKDDFGLFYLGDCLQLYAQRP
jgi:hypothetical protein